MLQKYFYKIILESIFFYYTLQNTSWKQEAEQEKIFEIHLNWKLTNMQFKIQCEHESAGWSIIPVEALTTYWKDLSAFS